MKRKIIISVVLCIISILFMGYRILSNYKYTVIIIDNNGNKLNEYKVNKGALLEDVVKPEKEGYLFVSWYNDGKYYEDNYVINEDLILEPKFVEKPELLVHYVVTFKIEDKIKTINVMNGFTVDRPSDPFKPGYSFVGWFHQDKEFDFNTKIDKDIELEAKFRNNVITINYDLDGGYGRIRENIKYGTKLVKPEEPKKMGYKFNNWTIDGKNYDFNTVIYEDITLKANWIPIEYVKVSFDTDGGSVIKSIYIEKGTKLDELPISNKEGYTFAYWIYDNNIFDKDMLITKDIVLKAMYK